ncbi:hypothetical protein JL720_16280 [Aureococcus anophagefferens]|nr:hypothetical protein JL720_16280 [Aureococcus anophagefferens]
MTLLLRCAASAACAIAADWSAARHRVGTVGGPPLDAAAGNDLIRARLADRFAGRRGPFLVSRLALGAELGVALEYARRARELSSDLGRSRQRWRLPATRREAAPPAAYAAAINATQTQGGLAAVFGTDAEREVLAALAPRARVGNRAEPFYFARPWSAALRGRRVLVVHPFAATIRAQYAAHAAGRSLWADGDVLPALDLVVVRAPVSLADAPPPHGSWSESLAATKAAIDAAGPVDVALLGCGSYGLPLAHHVLERGAVAIYVGGGLQVLFGIKGSRWMARPFFAAAANEHWVWPAADETPPGAAGVEGAAYWRPP